MKNFEVIKNNVIESFANKTKKDKIAYAINAGAYGLGAVSLEILKRSGSVVSDGAYSTLFYIMEPALSVASLSAGMALVMTAIAKKTKYEQINADNILPNFEDHSRGGR